MLLNYGFCITNMKFFLVCQAILHLPHLLKNSKTFHNTKCVVYICSSH
jgi:hypothetical protein